MNFFLTNREGREGREGKEGRERPLWAIAPLLPVQELFHVR
ncbi:MAG: hypothetical protein V7L05_11545 [Nostoc sp.]